MTDALRFGESSPTLARLRRGEPCFALGLRMARNVDVVRTAAANGYQKIWIDLEHSTMPLDIAAQMCATARDLAMDAWVRIPEGDFGAIGRLLDGGASGFIIPQVEDADGARHAVSFCRYPPDGGRSHNAFNAGTGYFRQTAEDRVMISNSNVAVQILLETPKAVANAAEIAAVPGVDIVGLGLNDLSAACGMMGQVQSGEMMELCQMTISAARLHNKLPVIGGLASPAHFRELLSMGAAPYIFAGIDTEILVAAFEQRIARWREATRDQATGKE